MSGWVVGCVGGWSGGCLPSMLSPMDVSERTMLARLDDVGEEVVSLNVIALVHQYRIKLAVLGSLDNHLHLHRRKREEHVTLRDFIANRGSDIDHDARHRCPHVTRAGSGRLRTPTARVVAFE